MFNNNSSFFQLANFQMLLFGFIGAAIGIIYSIGGFFYDLYFTGLNEGTALAFFALIGMPLTFGGAGFILGTIEMFIYRLFTK